MNQRPSLRLPRPVESYLIFRADRRWRGRIPEAVSGVAGRHQKAPMYRGHPTDNPKNPKNPNWLIQKTNIVKTI